MKKNYLLVLLVIALGFIVAPFYVKATGPTLQSIIDDAEEGAVIVLDRDYDEYLTIRKDITIDLAGNTISTNPQEWELINVVGATLTIKDSVGGGKIVQEAGGNAIQLNVDYDTDDVEGANNTEPRAKVILNSGTIESNEIGIALFNNSEFVMNGGKVIATGDEYYAVCGNGTINKTSNNYGVNSKIVINDGELVSDDYAIYQPQTQGETIINGGTITGKAGAVAVNRGILTINGGTLVSLGTDAIPEHQTVAYNGPDWAFNAVIATPSIYTTGVGTDERTVLTISGDAKLDAKGNAELIAFAIPDIPENQTHIAKAIANTDIILHGGRYSDDVSELLGEGYITKVISEEYVVLAEHNVTITSNENGTLTADKSKATLGDQIALTITPKDGYDLLNVVVLDADSKEIAVTDGKFVMPDSNVTVTAKYVKQAVVPDVKPTDKVETPTVGVVDKDKLDNILVNSLANNEELLQEIGDTEVKIELNIESVDKDSIDQSVLSAIESKTSGLNVAHFFEISFDVLDAENDTKIGSLTELTEKAELMILLPESMKNSDKDVNRVYYLVRQHGNTTDLLEATISEDGNYLVVKSDKFSTYALAYKDTKNEAAAEKDISKIVDYQNNPDTIDNTTFYLVIGGLSLIGLVGAGLYINKKRFN